MKAGVASPNGVVIKDIPQAAIKKPTDILVKVKAIAACGMSLMTTPFGDATPAFMERTLPQRHARLMPGIHGSLLC